ncbi:primosomal protein N' [Pseudoteredinibacter isoporae]|uniref:Replication restart protein PriA n=1 Tax=Pseudoteredinibacter isoporae TaxID=570281 RepID=A0A7X0JPA8_9GAMM|nr:primosomal protein N' [Pseudoteredinibacter isoporae]MBB6519807.1 primosomal protein N' (replication factor Y) [Pseudoteredinibacter isoporae]NHO85387.1 primosomal protein N' [Pseudoteredinibacter isoporae]NIB26161.1 primosomal protein N' [Pseudoteredinibacter isoporae]
MPPKTIIRLALPVPLRRLFDYLGEEGRVYPIGARVRVPFGQRELIGIVIEQTEDSEQDLDKLKPARALLDENELIPSDIRQLVDFCSRYYQCPLGEAYNTALPKLLRNGEAVSLPQQEFLQLSQEGLGLPPGGLAKARKQAALLTALQEQGKLDKTDLKRLCISNAVVKAMQEKGLLCWESEQLPTIKAEEQQKQEALELNDEQSAALEQLRYQTFACYLLEGTTGSGKTEVYLQAIAEVLRQGKQALVMIPEIGLTPQTLGRFQNRFRCPVVAIHSGLNDKERLQAWGMAKSGQAGIIIGTRSSVFTPLYNPGIIIIDEEHDLSFKQQDGVRYSGRDLAIFRAQKAGIPIVLGTATPSLETLHNAIQGRYHHLRLTRRAGAARPPAISVDDIKQKTLIGGLSQNSLDAIGNTLAAGNQVLVFLNRRGFAPSLICHNCGWVAECRHCSARMTLHKAQRQLRCHHCEASMPLPTQCPKCFSQELIGQGYGTQRSEETLQEYFPETQIIRIDRDSTRKKQAMHELLHEVDQGQPCILLGTQMLAKGHHFPNVTLVVIVDADGGLFSGDFRGPERMGQLITQVAGRAGRAEKPGRVIIQSHNKDHPLLETLLEQGYHLFARQILRERQLANMPPYRQLALLHCDSKDGILAESYLQGLRQWLEQYAPPTPERVYLGPFPAPMEKRKQMFRFQLQFNCENRRQMQQLLQLAGQYLEQSKMPHNIRCSLDVDPLDMM